MALAERFIARLARLGGFGRPTRPVMAHDGVLQVEPLVRPGRPATPRGKTPRPVSTPKTPPGGEPLCIPTPDPTSEDRERDGHHDHALRLARQEDWRALRAQIAAMDSKRAKTAGGMPVAELMAYGARADVVAAAEHALLSGRPAPDAPLLAGIEALEQVLSDHPDCPMMACIVAQAHIDIAWAWRGTGWEIEVPLPNREAFAAHLDRAADILAPYPASDTGSPLVAACHATLAVGRRADVEDVVAAYEAWIALDPTNARAYRAMGGHLLPRWHGSYERLELEARRAAAATAGTWGAGAYAWVMFDAIATDSTACARLDCDFFLDGLRDILRRTNDQYRVNLLAAYCANNMGTASTGHDEADHIRHQIARAAEWIVREHLTELHPMLWAHAARGFDNALRVRCPHRFAASGHADALRYLGDLFRREISQGHRVVFTEKGAETLAA